MGTRLYPMTVAVSKQLLPVGGKPMVYYPLCTLMEGGVREVCLISTPWDLPAYRRLLGDGSQWGMEIVYREQREAGGIAEAHLVAGDFVGSGPVVLILGDNIFHGPETLGLFFRGFEGGARVLAFPVEDPCRFGVIELDELGGVRSIEEKPMTPRSNWAVPGLYLHGADVVEVARRVPRGTRGELEITDVNREYLRQGRLQALRTHDDFVWFDAGTPGSLVDAGSRVHRVESESTARVGFPELAALRQGWIGLDQVSGLLSRMPNCAYRHMLEGLVRNSGNGDGVR